MRYVLLFMLGIGLGLWGRQASLPLSDSDALVSVLWANRFAPYVLLAPFGCVLFCLVLAHCSPRYARFNLAGAVLSFGFALAGLDTRAPDLPRYWVNQFKMPRWVYGQVVGLPKVRSRQFRSGQAAAEKTGAGQPMPGVMVRFQFRSVCWRSSPPKAAPRMSRRGRCSGPDQGVARFWRQLQLSLFLSAPEYEQIAQYLVPGQRAWLPVKLKLVRGQSNPGASDFGRWAFVNHQTVRGHLVKGETPLWLGKAAANRGLNGNDISIDRYRLQLSATIRDQVRDAPAAQRILPAIMLGDRRWLTREDWQALNRLGLGHLVAISGLHIGFAALLGYHLSLWLLRLWCRLWSRLAMPMPLQLGAWVGAWVAGATYSALSGFALTTVRALLALTMMCIFRWRFRQISLASIWCFSAAILLAFSPRWLLDVSFLLSFGAVGVLIWCAALRVGGESVVRQAWRLQWGLSLGLSPLNIGFFNQITWFAPGINFLVIPLFSFVFIPALAATVLVGCVWPELSAVLWKIVAGAVDWSMAGVLHLADYPPVASIWVMDSCLATATLLAAFAMWLMVRGWRTALFVGILLLISVCHLAPERSIASGGFRLTVLDVGQGLAVAVETRQHTMVYDTGPGFGEYHQVDRTWQPFLAFHGRQGVDLLALSHGDADHAGSAPAFVRDIKTEQTMSLQSEAAFLLPHLPCGAGHAWVWDGVTFEVLFPDGNLTAEDQDLTRNLSCVIKVTGRYHSVLLTGDIDRHMEAQLLERYTLGDSDATGMHPLKADILLVPHHGSKTSSSTGLIHHVAPTWAVVSHGYNNAFGHPHDAIKARYLARDVNWLSTQAQGAITFLSGVKSFSAQEGEQQDLRLTVARASPRFWYF